MDAIKKFNSLNRTKLFLGAASGILLTAAFPRTGFFWLAWVALVPLFYALRGLSRFEAFRLGLLTGLVHYLTLIYWLVHTMKTYGFLPLYLSLLILLLLSIYMSLYIGVFSAVLPMVCPTPAALLFGGPVLWIALEYIRSFLFSGFPWGLIGYSQYPWLSIIQISDISGVYGVSFIVLLSNTALSLVLLYGTQKSWQGKLLSPKIAAGSIAALVVLVALSLVYGIMRFHAVEKNISRSPAFPIAVVQGNIEQSLKWDTEFRLSTTEKYIRMSREVMSQNPELIVWPETATPFYFLYDPELSEMVLSAIREMDTYFLIGSPSFTRKNGSMAFYNSAYLISPEGSVEGKYDKNHLVPFGEYVPLREWLPFVGKIVEGVGDFMPGRKGSVLQWEETYLGVLICYEMIFPELSRAMVNNKAGLLVNITNDAWYGISSAPYQHFSMAVFRAVENRRSLIRSANTGISGFIDPAGRIIAQTDIFRDAILMKPVPVLEEISFYTRHGDIFAVFCLMICALFALARIKKIRKLFTRSD